MQKLYEIIQNYTKLYIFTQNKKYLEIKILYKI